MGRTSAKTAAEWLIAAHHQSGDPISNLRLQKILYYVQAWHLALRDQALFDEDFQAWIHGPVVPSLYQDYKAFGSGSIAPPPIDMDGDEPKFKFPALEQAAAEHINDVLKAYGDLSTWQLEQLTHHEQPWLDARGTLPVDAPCRNVISKESMRVFYKGQLSERA